MDTPDRAIFGAALTPGDLPVPDGVCPPANQAQIDLLKHGQARVARDRRFDPSPFTLVSRSNPEACSVLARRAQAEDYLAVRRIANEAGNRVAFGFLARVIFEGAAAAPGRNPFWVAVVHGEVAAWLRGYHRLDGLTTLHEIGVGVREQSHGIGTALLRLLVDDAMAMGSLAIRVSTPAELRSNAWYPKFGFVLTGQRPSPRRILNDYRLELAPPPG